MAEHNTAEEWAAEYLTEQQAAKDEKAWQKAIRVESFLANAVEPKDLIGFYDSDPTKRPRWPGPQRRPPLEAATSPSDPADVTIFQQAAAKKSDFVWDIERAFTQFRGEIPMSYWLSVSPTDLRAFGDGLYDDLAQILEDSQYAMGVEQAKREEIRAEWDRAIKTQENRNSILVAFNFNPNYVSHQDLLESVTLDLRGRADEKVPDEIDDFMESERVLLQAMRDGAESPDLAKLQELERFGVEDERRFFLSDGDVLSPKDHKRYFDQEIQFLEAQDVDDIRAITDEDFEKLLTTREELLRFELRQNPQQLHEILTPGRGIGGFEGSLQAFGQIIEKGFHYGGMIAEAIDSAEGAKRLGSAVVDIFRDKSLDHMAETQRQVEASTGLPNPELMAEALNEEAKILWDNMAEGEFAEDRDTYIEMGGGDELQAFGLFAADLLSQITPEEQQNYVSDLGLQEDERMIQLRDADFTVGDQVLNWLSIWGRNVPGRLSTMFSVLITDRDVHEMIRGTENVGDLISTFQRIGEISEAAGHTPSRQLGIDGTAVGLMLDLGGGIAFDPTTWIFGPRLMSRGVAPSTVKAAQRLSNGRWVAQMEKDAIMALKSPSHGPSSVYQIMDFLDDVGMAEVFNLIDFTPQVFSKATWRLKSGHKAVELPIEFLDNLIDDALRKGDDLSYLADDMLRNSPEHPVVIEISRADRSIRIVEGSKRVMAGSGDNAITHLPATVMIVDDIARGGARVVPGYTANAVRAMERALKIKPHGGPNTVIAANLKKAAELVRSRGERLGSAGTATLKGGEEISIKFVDQGGGAAVWWAELADGEIVGVVQVGGGSAGFATMPNFTKQGVFTHIMDAAHELGEDLISLFPMKIVTKDAALTLKAYAASKLKDAVPEGTRAGKFVDDLLRDGEELGKPFEKPGKGTVSQQRPDAIFPQRMLMGDDLDPAALHEIVQRAIVERGRVPRGAQYAAVARGSGDRILMLARANAPGRWLERFLTPMFLGKRFELMGPHAIGKITDTLYRLFGEDSIKLNEHLAKLMGWQRLHAGRAGEAAKRLSELAPREQRLRALKDSLGNIWDEGSGVAKPKAGSDAARELHAARRAINKEDSALQAKYAEIDKATGAVGATDDLNKILLEVWEDYNRTYIATNKAWSHVELVDGMVPWEKLGKGTIPPDDVLTAAQKAANSQRVFPVSVADEAKAAGIDVEVLAQKLMHNQNATLAFEAPVSPLDLILARAYGGSAYTRATHNGIVSGFREAARAAHRLWTIDKVFTIATAATVSFDELLRIFHIAGPTAMWRWAADRAVAMEARSKAFVHGKGFKKEAGAEFLSEGKIERLRALHDMPTLLKQAERQTYEQHGQAWTDVLPKDPAYQDAARAWAGGQLQDTGFRAMLRGRKAYREWFAGPDGERLRQGTVVGVQEGKPATLFIDAADLHYDGWITLFDDVILKPAHKAGKFKEVRQAWLDGANRIDDASALPKDLPDIAYQYMGPVRGVKKDMGSKANIAQFQEAFFDKLFMDPVNYRRGFLAELVRTNERSRLYSLFESQGKRVVSDVELEGLLGIQGLAGAQRTGLRMATQEMALRAGYIPESYLDDLVEVAVLKEIENVLYAFDSGSRLGAQAKAVFPFGKPWADMAAFWGREVLRKPALRGWINDSNFLGLRSANDAGLLSFPLVPTRPSTLISRLAATDFTIDQGLIGPLFPNAGDPEGILHQGGLIPGSTSTDFSPLFFLPTGGDNPFSYLLPSIGIVGMGWIDFIMQTIYDPIEQPLEYQNLKDDIAQVIPGAAFSQGGLLSLTLGGGTAARLGGLAVDVAGMLGGESYFNITSEMGDISRELDRTRGISALMSDPKERQKILDAKSPAEANQLMQDLAIKADKLASQSHFGESFVRGLIPAKTSIGNQQAEIQQVWIDALGFEQLAFVARGRDPKNMNAEDLRTLSADIRKEFFDLEPYQRDILVVLQPSLAVNMVGSFEWTANAVNLNLEGVQESYRTGGSKTELALHESLVRRGIVRPIQPITRERRIWGVEDRAMKSAAKELYTTQADKANEELFTFIIEFQDEFEEVGDVVAVLQDILDSDFAKARDLRTLEEVWFNWNAIEADFELFDAEREGAEPIRGETRKAVDATFFDFIRERIAIPDELRPWGRTFPGIDEENVSEKFKDFTLKEIDDKTRALADALEIRLTVDMTGEELFEQVQQKIVQRHSFAYDVARPDFDRMTLDRSNRSGQSMLFEAAQSDKIVPEFQEHIENFIFIDNLMGDRYNDERFVPLEDQYLMRDKFLFLMNGSKDQKTDWEGIWKSQYERKYGPLDWIPPEPKSPFDENGDVAGGVIRPSIRQVVDGDSIMIQEHPGSKRLNGIRLLGVDAPEMGGPDPDGALLYWNRLKDALLTGLENGDSIYFVQDPRFGKTDQYGRILAWLWIGDTPFYNVEDLLPHRDPSGGE